jgi:hypothetical protein
MSRQAQAAVAALFSIIWSTVNLTVAFAALAAFLAIGWGLCHVTAREKRELYRYYRENGKS